VCSGDGAGSLAVIVGVVVVIIVIIVIVIVVVIFLLETSSFPQIFQVSYTTLFDMTYH